MSEFFAVKTLDNVSVTRYDGGVGDDAMLTVTVKGNKIIIRFPYDKGLIDIVKTIPGRRFVNDWGDKYWTAPISVDAARILRSAGFSLDEQLQDLLRQFSPPEQIANIELPRLKRELFPFQKQGVAFIESRGGRALIADEMGLGKTIQVLAWLAMNRDKRPAVIIVPASLKLNWAREIEMTFTHEERVTILSGIQPYPVQADIVIINYDILSEWVETLTAMNPQVVVLDECHYIKNSSAQRTKAAKLLTTGVPHVIALSGTPIVNRPVEMYNAINIVSAGKLFPKFWDYAHRYCGARYNGYGWDFSGASNTKELHEKLTQTIMIRRVKQDVLAELPEKIRSIIPLEIDNRDEYDYAADDFLTFIGEHLGEIEAERAAKAHALVKINYLKQLAAKGKFSQAVDWIEDALESNGKLVVFAVHQEIITKLMEKFGEIAVRVDGSTTPDARQKAVEKFQNDPACRLFVGNIKAAGVGLTLTAASTVAFLELPWTPGELVQAEDRCHRIGQTSSVNIYYLIANGTIDVDIADLLDRKREVLSSVLDGRDVDEENLLTELIERMRKNAPAKTER